MEFLKIPWNFFENSKEFMKNSMELTKIPWNFHLQKFHGIFGKFHGIFGKFHGMFTFARKDNISNLSPPKRCHPLFALFAYVH